jgi:protease I
MGKRIAILAEDLYEDLELWYPLLRSREAGHEAIVVGNKDVHTSKHGYEVQVDLAADQVSANEFDAVIIPGGYAPDRLRRHPVINSFVRNMHENGKLVAAICHGPWVLISAGVLMHHKATAFYSIKDDLINAGARYLDEAVVVDGNLITSRTPEDLPFFMREVLKALG